MTIATRTRVETRLSVARAADGRRARVDHSTEGGPQRPRIRPVVLSSDADGARVALVPEGALLLAGDDVSIRIQVGPAARLTLIEPGGTVAYDMRGDRARWTVDLDLGPGATLVWYGEPFVAAAGSDTHRRVRARVGEGARLVMREILVLGRHGERSGRLRQELLVDGVAGSPVVADGLDLGPASAPMLLGGRRAVGSVLVAGASLPGGAPGTRFDYEGGATLVRRLADEAHLAVDGAAWSAALEAVRR